MGSTAILHNVSEPGTDQNEQSWFSKIGGITLKSRGWLCTFVCVYDFQKEVYKMPWKTAAFGR